MDEYVHMGMVMECCSMSVCVTVYLSMFVRVYKCLRDNVSHFGNRLDEYVN